jgi:primosomal protein N' (replication factor Y)
MRAGRASIQRARRLRGDPTDAEKHLWNGLRLRQLGWDFRRQHPVPPYFADFACIGAKLIVEVDGGQHSESDDDKARDAFLLNKGWRVLRFWNNDVLQNRDGVLQTILAALPPPQLSPASQGRESLFKPSAAKREGGG